MIATTDSGPYGFTVLAGNSRGFRVAAWDDGGRIYVATSRRGGPFGEPRRVPGSGALPIDDPSVRLAADESGNALVAWEYDDNSRGSNEEDRFDEGCCIGMRFTVLRRNGGFDETRTLSPPGRTPWVGPMEISEGRVGIAFGETLDVSDPGPRPGLLVYTQTPSGRSARVDTVDAGVQASNVRIHALAFTDGRPRVIYRRFFGDPPLVESVADASHAFGPPAVVIKDFDPFGGPIVATGAGGRQAIVYQHEEDPEGERIYAGARAPGKRFKIRPLGKAGGDVPLEAAVPAVARNGIAFAAWVGPFEPSAISGSLSLPGTPFTTPRLIARTGYSTQPPDVDVNSDGTAVVAWQDSLTSSHRVVFVGRDGRPHGSARLGNDRGVEPITIDSPGAAIDDRGRAVVLYRIGNDVIARRATFP